MGTIPIQITTRGETMIKMYCIKKKKKKKFKIKKNKKETKQKNQKKILN